MTDHTTTIADLATKLAHPRVPAVVTIALAFEGGLSMAEADDQHQEATHDPR